MVFLFEEKISENKRIDQSLKECLGLGKTYSKKLYYNLGFNVRKNYSFKNAESFFSLKFIDNIEQKVLFLNEFKVSAEKKKSLKMKLNY